MTPIEIAKQKAAENKKNEQLENERLKRVVAAEAKQKENLERLASECLEGFVGENGITREGSSLYNKHNNRIAFLEVRWEEWENPNSERREMMSGFGTYWVVYDKYGSHRMAGGDLKSFGEYMAEHL